MAKTLCQRATDKVRGPVYWLRYYLRFSIRTSHYLKFSRNRSLEPRLLLVWRTLERRVSTWVPTWCYFWPKVDEHIWVEQFAIKHLKTSGLFWNFLRIQTCTRIGADSNSDGTRLSRSIWAGIRRIKWISTEADHIFEQPYHWEAWKCFLFEVPSKKFQN